MFYNNQDFTMDQNATIMGDGNFIDQDMNVDINVGMNQGPTMMEAQEMTAPIMEPVQERCIHKTIIHQVPHA